MSWSTPGRAEADAEQTALPYLDIAFLMDRKGEWRLSPAFDISYAYNPAGPWTSQHQMSLGGKRDQFQRSDLIEFGRFCDIKANRASKIIDEIKGAVLNWHSHADRAGVPGDISMAIRGSLRADLS